MSENNSDISKDELENRIKRIKLELEDLKNQDLDSDYIHTLYDLALLQSEKQEFDESIKNLKICLNHFEKSSDNLGKSSVYGSLGVIYYLKGNYDKSLQNYRDALDLYKKLHQKHEHIVCLKAIGLNLMKLNKLGDAVNIFLECAELSSKEKKIEDLLDCISHLVQIYEAQEKWDVLIELYQKALQAFNELNDTVGIINSHFNLGILYKKMNQYSQALTHYKKGTDIANISNFPESIIKGTSLVGEIFMRQNQFKKAANEFIKGLSVAKKVKANNAETQLKILLNTIGIDNNEIIDMLKQHEDELDKNKI